MTNREIDSLVAQHIFNYTLDYEFEDYLGAPTVRELRDGNDEWGVLPSYSEDVGDAWLVVEKMRREWAAGNSTDNFWTFRDCGSQPWQAQIEFFPDHDAPAVEFEAEAETLPMAICKAALAARGVPS